MVVKELINQRKRDFDKIFEFYRGDIASIRTGRATPALVENIEVDYYGQKSRVKELASITAPEPRTLMIQPWDQNALEAIAGAIRKSEIGLNPAVDGHVVRLTVPTLTEERRREFIKLLKQKAEETRIKIRRVREDIWDKVQRLEKEKQIREDEKFRAKDDLQKIIDEYSRKIEELEKKKEQELLI